MKIVRVRERREKRNFYAGQCTEQTDRDRTNYAVAHRPAASAVVTWVLSDLVASSLRRSLLPFVFLRPDSPTIGRFSDAPVHESLPANRMNSLDQSIDRPIDRLTTQVFMRGRARTRASLAENEPARFEPWNRANANLKRRRTRPQLGDRIQSFAYSRSYLDVRRSVESLTKLLSPQSGILSSCNFLRLPFILPRHSRVRLVFFAGASLRSEARALSATIRAQRVREKRRSTRERPNGPGYLRANRGRIRPHKRPRPFTRAARDKHVPQ